MSAHVVIVGTGFAGLTVARALVKHRREAQISVTAVNRENYALFTPMLPEVASGLIEPRHVAEPFRTSVPRAGPSRWTGRSHFPSRQILRAS